jgi:hypothetical protein
MNENFYQLARIFYILEPFYLCTFSEIYKEVVQGNFTEMVVDGFTYFDIREVSESLYARSTQ